MNKDYELDHSEEEITEIAHQICDHLIADGEVNIKKFKVTLFSEELIWAGDGKYEDDLIEKHAYDFDINPKEYMEVVIDEMLKEIKCDWDVEDAGGLCFLYSELIKEKYSKTKSLIKLFNGIERFWSEWCINNK